MIADVLVDVKSSSLEFLYSYNVPLKYQNKLKIGTRVLVPFNNQIRLGFVYNIKNDNVMNLLDILEIMEKEPFLTTEFFDMADFVFEKTFKPKNIMNLQLIPSILFLNFYKEVSIINPSLINEEILNEFKNNTLKFKNIKTSFYQKLKRLEKEGAVEITTKYKNKMNFDSKIFYKVREPEGLIKLSTKQNELYTLLSEAEVISKDELEKYNISKKTLKKLIEVKLVEEFEKRVEDKKEIETISFEKFVNQATIDQLFINASKYYFEIYDFQKKVEILKQIYQNNTADGTIFLIVENPSLIEKYQKHLSALKNIYFYHNYFTDSEKTKTIDAIFKNKAKIVIGNKQALFFTAPKTNLVIVDTNGVEDINNFDKYYLDVFDVANFKANYHNVSILYFGSYLKVKNYFELKENKIYKIDEEQIKKTDLVDLAKDLKEGNTSYLSRNVVSKIRKHLENNKKVIVVNTRKADSSYLLCKNCFRTVSCPNCGKGLKYFSLQKKNVCQNCLYQTNWIDKCPSCGGKQISYMGYGLQKMLKDIKSEFREYKINYLETYSFSKARAELNKLYKNKFDILVASKAILKSEDITKETLIVLVNVDLDLKLSLYNAKELTYLLLKNAKDKSDYPLVIQTNKIEDLVFDALDKNYQYFYQQELESRDLSQMPPYSQIYHLLVSSNQGYMATYKAAYNLKEAIKKNYHVLGPVEANIYNLDKYNFKITIKDNAINSLTVKKIIEENKLSKVNYKLFAYPILL